MVEKQVIRLKFQRYTRHHIRSGLCEVPGIGHTFPIEDITVCPTVRFVHFVKEVADIQVKSDLFHETGTERISDAQVVHKIRIQAAQTRRGIVEILPTDVR